SSRSSGASPVVGRRRPRWNRMNRPRSVLSSAPCPTRLSPVRATRAAGEQATRAERRLDELRRYPERVRTAVRALLAFNYRETQIDEPAKCSARAAADCADVRLRAAEAFLTFGRIRLARSGLSDLSGAAQDGRGRARGTRRADSGKRGHASGLPRDGQR